MREGYHLTDEAETERQDFRTEYGDGNCSCHISPPCGSCAHPGNPRNLDEDDSAWVKDEPVEITSCAGCIGASFDTRFQCAGCVNFSKHESEK